MSISLVCRKNSNIYFGSWVKVTVVNGLRRKSENEKKRMRTGQKESAELVKGFLKSYKEREAKRGHAMRHWVKSELRNERNKKKCCTAEERKAKDQMSGKKDCWRLNAKK